MAEHRLVRDLMAVGVATCKLDSSLEDIARFLLEKHIESMVVLDKAGHGVGVVSRNDIIKAYANDDWHDVCAEDVMQPDVPQLPPTIPLVAAAQMMQDWNVRQVFIMHHADGITYPAASLSYTHLMRYMIAQKPDDLNDLGIKAARQTPLDSFIEKRDAARRAAMSDEE
jgi:predicted transcriptional regulator